MGLAQNRPFYFWPSSTSSLAEQNSSPARGAASPSNYRPRILATAAYLLSHCALSRSSLAIGLACPLISFFVTSPGGSPAKNLSLGQEPPPSTSPGSPAKNLRLAKNLHLLPPAARRRRTSVGSPAKSLRNPFRSLPLVPYCPCLHRLSEGETRTRTVSVFLVLGQAKNPRTGVTMAKKSRKGHGDSARPRPVYQAEVPALRARLAAAVAGGFVDVWRWLQRISIGRLFHYFLAQRGVEPTPSADHPGAIKIKAIWYDDGKKSKKPQQQQSPAPPLRPAPPPKPAPPLHVSYSNRFLSL